MGGGDERLGGALPPPGSGRRQAELLLSVLGGQHTRLPLHLLRPEVPLPEQAPQPLLRADQHDREVPRERQVRRALRCAAFLSTPRIFKDPRSFGITSPLSE